MPPALNPSDIDRLTRLTDALRGVDLASADGRAGIGQLLAEVERMAPGCIYREASRTDFARLATVGAPSCRP